MATIATAAGPSPEESTIEDPPGLSREHRHSWSVGLRSPKVLVGSSILACFVIAGIVGPIAYRVDPSALSSAVLSAPSAAHWLGTTQTGQDILAQLINGTRISLLVGFVAAAIATAFSLIVGLLGGYLGGFGDELLSLLSNVFLVIPTLPLVIVLAGYLPSKGSLSVAVVIAVTGWAWVARQIRAQTLSIRNRDYVAAARAIGDRTLRIIFCEILPNELAVVASNFLFTVIFAILTSAALSFLGLGDLNQWSWGTMLYWAENNGALQVGAWWWWAPPGLAIGLVGTSLALINFGIDEFVNPRLRAANIATRSAGKAARRRPPRRAAAVTSAGPTFTTVARPTRGTGEQED